MRAVGAESCSPRNRGLWTLSNPGRQCVNVLGGVRDQFIATENKVASSGPKSVGRHTDVRTRVPRDVNINHRVPHHHRFVRLGSTRAHHIKQSSRVWFSWIRSVSADDAIEGAGPTEVFEQSERRLEGFVGEHRQPASGQRLEKLGNPGVGPGGFEQADGVAAVKLREGGIEVGVASGVDQRAMHQRACAITNHLLDDSHRKRSGAQARQDVIGARRQILPGVHQRAIQIKHHERCHVRGS